MRDDAESQDEQCKARCGGCLHTCSACAGLPGVEVPGRPPARRREGGPGIQRLHRVAGQGGTPLGPVPQVGPGHGDAPRQRAPSLGRGLAHLHDLLRRSRKTRCVMHEWRGLAFRGLGLGAPPCLPPIPAEYEHRRLCAMMRWPLQSRPRSYHPERHL